jgi:hypothetical protein
MGTNDPAALTCISPRDGFPFLKHNSRNEKIKEKRFEDGKTVERTTRATRMAENKTAGQTTCEGRLAEINTTVNEGVEVARPTLKGFWVEVSHPGLTGSWVEVKDPNLQDTWIDGPPSRAPSCGDDNIPLPDLKGIKGKVEFVLGWLKAMGSAIQP